MTGKIAVPVLVATETSNLKATKKMNIYTMIVQI